MTVGATGVAAGELAAGTWSRVVGDALREPEQLSVHLQPIMDVARGVICGYEALARFAGPPDLPPDRWFAAAERVGLAAPLEALALRQAFAAGRALPPGVFLTVNVTPRLLGSGPVQDVLAHRDLTGVVIELTEHVPLDEDGKLRGQLDALRGTGARIALDDLGSGYAGVRQIIDLRPDIVKIDRSIIEGIHADPAKAALVESLGLLTGRLDAWMLAEGVETEADARLLAALGVPLMQGYLLGRPTPRAAGLDPVLGARLRLAAARTDAGPSVGALSTPAQAVRVPGDGRGSGAVGDPAPGWALVRVDSHGRATEVWCDGATGWRATELTAHAGESAADLARRALLRDRRDWTAPVVVIDDAGLVVGVVGMQRLLLAATTP